MTTTQTQLFLFIQGILSIHCKLKESEEYLCLLQLLVDIEYKESNKYFGDFNNTLFPPFTLPMSEDTYCQNRPSRTSGWTFWCMPEQHLGGKYRRMV